MLSKHFVALESKSDSKVLGQKATRTKNAKAKPTANNQIQAQKHTQQEANAIALPQKTLTAKQLAQLQNSKQTATMQSSELGELPDLAHLLQDDSKPKLKNTRTKAKKAIQKQEDTNAPKNAKTKSNANTKARQSKQTHENLKISTETTKTLINNEINESSTQDSLKEHFQEHIIEQLAESTNEQAQTIQNTHKGAQSRITRDVANIPKESRIENEQKGAQWLAGNAKDSKQQGGDSSKQNSKDSQSTLQVIKNEAQVHIQEDFQNDLLESLEQGTQAMEEFELGKQKALHNAQKSSSTQNEKATESKQTQQTNLGVKASQEAQVSQRTTLARETIKTFAQQIRDEVKNYKPPITRILLELHPQNLGKVELTISKRGKDLVLQVLSNQNAITLFSQNQVELRTNLNQMGFENVDMNFNTPQDGQGEQNAKQDSQSQEFAQSADTSEEENQGNKNSLSSVMEITIPRYA
ncbi:flagellar hook-length control protein FliK [Helicobacter sp. 23-1046]